MNSVIVIVACVFCAVGFSATVAIALGRAAARGDEELAREIARERPATALTTVRRNSYAGLDTSRSRGSACEPLLLYETFSVPSIPAWRWPGTEQ